MSRYIDADALKNDLNDNYVFSGFKDLLNDFISIVDNQPTADVRENVRSDWIDLGKDRMTRWRCPVCFRKDDQIYNFCPNCGADLRGDRL